MAYIAPWKLNLGQQQRRSNTTPEPTTHQVCVSKSDASKKEATSKTPPSPTGQPGLGFHP
jgi:hypothetical protein